VRGDDRGAGRKHIVEASKNEGRQTDWSQSEGVEIRHPYSGLKGLKSAYGAAQEELAGSAGEGGGRRKAGGPVVRRLIEKSKNWNNVRHVRRGRNFKKWRCIITGQRIPLKGRRKGIKAPGPRTLGTSPCWRQSPRRKRKKKTNQRSSSIRPKRESAAILRKPVAPNGGEGVSKGVERSARDGKCVVSRKCIKGARRLGSNPLIGVDKRRGGLKPLYQQKKRHDRTTSAKKWSFTKETTQLWDARQTGSEAKSSRAKTRRKERVEGSGHLVAIKTPNFMSRGMGKKHQSLCRAVKGGDKGLLGG